jgi:predicted enzyme related to lactoylglutathione lyase
MKMTRQSSGLMLALLLTAACAKGQPPAAPAAQPADKAPATFDYVGGLALRAKQPKELALWYTQRFGLPVTIEFPGGVAGGFKAGSMEFAFAIVAAEGAHPGSSPGTGYFVLHVTDFDRFLVDAAARGVTPFERTSDDMGRFASFRDPEGNQVGIWGK